MTASPEKRLDSRPSRVIPCIVAILLAVLTWGAVQGFVYVRNEERKSVVAAWRARLEAVADARKAAVEAWLAERRTDAQVLAWDSALIGLCLEKVCPKGADLATPQYELDNYVRFGGFLGAYLFTPGGELLLAGEPGAQPCPDVPARVRQVGAERRYLLDEVSSDSGCGDSRIGFLAPVIQRTQASRGSPDGPIVGVVALYLKPETALFPILAAADPGVSSLGVYLVRRHAGSVQISSPPPGASGSAWERPLAAPRSDSLECTAASGGQGFGAYGDYRGRRVLSAYRWIPEAGWGLVAKVDEEAALAAWRREVTQEGLLGALGILCVTLALVAGWRAWAARRYRFLMERVRDREERLRALAFGTEDTVFIKDCSGRYLLVNPAAARLLGVDASSTVGRGVGDFLPRDVAETLETHDREAIEQGRPFQGEEVIPIQGELHTFLSARIPIRDAEGRVQGVAGVLRDITERKKNEVTLARRAQTLAALYRLSQEFSQAQTLDEVLGTLLGGAVDYFGFVDAAVLLRVPGDERLQLAAHRNVSRELRDSLSSLTPDQGVTGRVFRTGKAQYLDDYTADPDAVAASLQARGHSSVAFVPLRLEEEVLGVVTASSPAPRTFPEEERGALESLGHIAALALSRSRTEAALRQEAGERRRAEERLRRLHEATAALTGKSLFAGVAEALAHDLGTRWMLISQVGGGGLGLPAALFQDGREIRCAPFPLADTPSGAATAAGGVLQCDAGARQAFPRDEFLSRHGIESYLAAPLSDSKGRVMGALCTFSDSPRTIGLAERELFSLYGRRVAGEVERMRTEERLAEARRTLDTLIQNLPGAVYRSSGDGERSLEYISAGCLPLTDHPAAAFLGERGLRLGQLVVPEDRGRVSREIERAVAEGRPYELEYRIHDRNGGVRWVYDVGRTVSGSEGGCVLEGVLLDQTDRRTLEAQLTHSQRMEALGRLAGGVAHDFNNLLTAISGYSELLLRRLSEDERSARAVHEICRASDRAAALTRQLLTFSRKQAVEPRVMDFSEAVEDVLRMMGGLLGEDVALFAELPRETGFVRADAGQLEQVALNLLVNARDAMPHGGRLSVRTSTTTAGSGASRGTVGLEPGDYAVLEVSDTGTGIAPDVLEHIFEPFFTTKELGKGTGLGLATVYGIVRQAGGGVSVDSTPGTGSVFRAYWPLYKGIPTPEDLVAQPTPSPGAGRAVLIAEDEESVRQLAAEYLEDLGYSVVAVVGGPEALAAAGRPGRFDVLVTDVVMPGMSGPELASALRRSRPGLPVIFMSGHTGEAAVERGADGAGTSFLQKPFRLADLSRAVEEALS